MDGSARRITVWSCGGLDPSGIQIQVDEEERSFGGCVVPTGWLDPSVIQVQVDEEERSFGGCVVPSVNQTGSESCPTGIPPTEIIGIC